MHRREIMCRCLPGAAGVSLVIRDEAAAITSSEYHPLADGNSGTDSVDGAPIPVLMVAWGATLITMPRR
jgi:hypothetical protein